MKMRYGYGEAVWNNAVQEAKLILAERARISHTISYSELASQIRSASFDPASKAFATLLGDVSSHEFGNGRGMLTVLVVHKGGDMKPGKGFFELAQSLGLSGDADEIWIEQFKFVTEFWKKN